MVELLKDKFFKDNENKDDVTEKVNTFANNVKDAIEGTVDGIKNIVNKDKE